MFSKLYRQVTYLVIYFSETFFETFFRGELQHVGHEGEQKINCQPITTRERTGVRLKDELFVLWEDEVKKTRYFHFSRWERFGTL